MVRSAILIFSLLLIQETTCPGQVRIRLFASRSPGSVSFTVTGGRYELSTFNDTPKILEVGSLVLFSKTGERIAVKYPGTRGFLCDSLYLKSVTHYDKFCIRINGKDPVRQYYSGNLICKYDLGTLVLVNSCDPEVYIAGVVRAEGGEKKELEYFKTQSVIARTYLYCNFNKHIADGFNLCDNTHCQAYSGITTDSLIIRAARETSGQVILGPDSTLINSAFHSNCGGETAASEDVWLTGESYLKSVKDTYCLTSPNASWQKTIPKAYWMNYLALAGYKGNTLDSMLLNISQKRRMKYLSAGNFSVPFRNVREDLNLRSSYFSLSASGDSVIFTGRGYGHGVGLCQEGAMAMALKGFDYKKIISFYYTGVRVADITSAVAPTPLKGGPVN